MLDAVTDIRKEILTGTWFPMVTVLKIIPPKSSLTGCHFTCSIYIFFSNPVFSLLHFSYSPHSSVHL